MTHLSSRSPNRISRPKNARYNALQAPSRGFSAADVSQAVLDKRARKLLNAKYENYKGRGGWNAVARDCKLFTAGGQPNRALAYLIAKGERPVSESLRRMAFMANKKDFRRFVRGIAVPFLARNWRD